MDSGLISTEGPREKYSVRVVGFHVVLTAGPLTILSVTLLSDWFVPCTSTVDQNVTGPYHRRFSAVPLMHTAVCLTFRRASAPGTCHGRACVEGMWGPGKRAMSRRGMQSNMGSGPTRRTPF